MNLFSVKTAEKKSQNILHEVQEIIVPFVFIQNILIKIFLVIERVNVTDLWNQYEKTIIKIKDGWWFMSVRSAGKEFRISWLRMIVWRCLGDYYKLRIPIITKLSYICTFYNSCTVSKLILKEFLCFYECVSTWSVFIKNYYFFSFSFFCEWNSFF